MLIPLLPSIETRERPIFIFMQPTSSFFFVKMWLSNEFEFETPGLEFGPIVFSVERKILTSFYKSFTFKIKFILVHSFKLGTLLNDTKILFYAQKNVEKKSNFEYEKNYRTAQ